MEPLKQINSLDMQVNALRLELIRIIADINRMVSTNNVKARQKEYSGLKLKYYETQQQIDDLNAEKSRIQNGLSGNKQQAA